MKKIYALSIAMLFIINLASTQIPNFNFETWETYTDPFPPYNQYQKPDLWVGFLPASPTTISFSIEKNADNFPIGTGQFSMIIKSNIQNGVNGIAMSYDAFPGNLSLSNIQPSFAVNSRPASLCLYYKYLPVNTDTMIISCFFFKNKLPIGYAIYLSPETVSNWRPLVIPATFSGSATPDSATIILATFIHPGYQNSGSKLYVDNLSFNTLIASTSETTSENRLFTLLTNPASDFISMQINDPELLSSEMTFNLYNTIGKRVASEAIKNQISKINTANIGNGIYIIEVTSMGLSQKQKLIIQR